MASDSLGLRIRRARERKRWTQAQLADAVGVSPRAVGDWERDVKRPLNSIGALEHVLGVSLTGQEAADSGEIELRALLKRLREDPDVNLDDQGVERVLRAYRGDQGGTASAGAGKRAG